MPMPPSTPERIVYILFEERLPLTGTLNSSFGPPKTQFVVSLQTSVSAQRIARAVEGTGRGPQRLPDSMLPARRTDAVMPCGVRQ
jgi:hypothetical protein